MGLHVVSQTIKQAPSPAPKMFSGNIVKKFSHISKMKTKDESQDFNQNSLKQLEVWNGVNEDLSHMSNPLISPDSLHTLIMVGSRPGMSPLSPLNIASSADLIQMLSNQPIPEH